MLMRARVYTIYILNPSSSIYISSLSNSHSLHPNHQFLFRHVSLRTGAAVGLGSTQTKPNHSLDVHVPVAVGVAGSEVGDGDGMDGSGGADVIGWEMVDEEVVVIGSDVDVEEVTVEVRSLQPHQPGVLQVVEEVEGVEDDDDDVEVAVAGVDTLLLLVVVTSSLQPNQPGVLHEEVEVEVVVTGALVAVPEVVDVSSRQPHQPGV
jgi:hypothetical protein